MEKDDGSWQNQRPDYRVDHFEETESIAFSDLIQLSQSVLT